MVSRTIVVRLRAEFDQARRQVAEFSRTVKDNATQIDDLSNRVGILGTALTGTAALAVARYAAFEKQMSSVQAATRATGAELDSLRAAAIKAGADTQFSATEAAAGIEELAKAGVSTADILGGGLTGALNLAAAGNLEVADAAQIAAVSLKQFNLGGGDVSHIADLLAAGAGKAVGSVSDLGAALNQSGLIASQTGLSIEETTAGLAAFASAGLLGSDAGTSFKTMLQVLAAPSSTAAAEMDRLGISAYDAQGRFVGLEALAGNLRSSLAGLTEEQKSASLATIFGSDAVRAASVIYSEGALGIQQWTDAVDQQGYAAEQARIQSDNLLGDLERLGGSFDTVLIQSGSGVNESLRLLVQGAEAAVDAVGQIPAPVLSVTTAIAGSGGLALVGVAALGKLAVGFAEAKAAAEQLGVSTKTAGLAAGGLGVVLAGVGVGLSIMASRAAESQGRVEQLAQTWNDVGEATTATNNLIRESLTKNTDNLVDGNRTLIELADQVGVSTEDLIGYIEGEADAIDRVNAATDEYANQGGWIGAIAQRSTESANLRKELDDLSGEYVRSKEVAELDARAKEAGADATEGMTAATEEATGALHENSEALDENWQAQLDASGAVLSLRDAQAAAEAAYDDATKALEDNGKTLDVTTEKGRANRAALDRIASSGFELVDSLRASGASLDDVQGAMATARERFIATATAMGMGEKAAARLADELQLIPKNVTTTATVNTGDALARVGNLWDTLQSIDGKTVTASVAIRQYGQAALATGGRAPGYLPGFPTGGRLPGSSPANPMEDNLLGINEAGMPHVRVRSREYLVNEPAADYYGDQLLGALNARAIPREALTALPGLAGGGAVGGAQRRVDDAVQAVRKARKQLADARDRAREAAAAERRAQRTGSEADDRTAARNAQRAERLQREAERKVEATEARLADARDKRDRLREQSRETSTAVRRGEISDSVTSSLSSALGVVDELRDQSRNSDLGDATRRNLARRANQAERALTRLYGAAEKVETRLAGARDRMAELQQISDQVADRLSSEQSISDAFVTRTDQWSGVETRTITAKDIVAGAQTKKHQIQTFAQRLKKLAAAGLTGAILFEISQMGTADGIATADALLADVGSIDDLNAAYKGIEFYSNQAGQGVTEGYAKGGLAAAEAFVKGLEKQQKSIEKQIAGWGTQLGRSLLGALGLRQTKNGSIVPRALGGSMYPGQTYLVGEKGPELVTPSRPGFVHTAEQTRYAMLQQPTTTYNFKITSIHPVNEAPSVTTNKVLARAAGLGRF